MHVDAMTVSIACVRKMNVFELMPLHCHVCDIAELALISELKAIFAPQTGVTFAVTGQSDASHSRGLVEKLESPLTAG